MAPKTRSKQGTPEIVPAGGATSTTPSLRREGSRSRTRDEVWDAKYAVDLATTTRDENVFLFVPNLIGYTRVILAAAALCFMPYHPKYCTILYTISCLLDALDGQAARALGQTSKFGSVLDMVTDRCTTACLLCFLSASEAYRGWSLAFQFLITLDFSSHYIHMYSSLVTGSASHKTVTSDVSRILWLYYNNSTTLFIFCFLNEAFFVCLYLNPYWTSTIFTSLPHFVTQLDGTSSAIFVRLLRNLTWPQVVAAISFPVMLGKQIINVVQFWKASKILVGVDLAERQAKREAAVTKSL